MTLKEKAQRAAALAVLEPLIKYVKKNPQDNLVKLVDAVQRFAGTVFPAKNFYK